jgi:FkbM family methyltransferase
MPRWLRVLGHWNRMSEIPRCISRISNWPGVVARYLGLKNRYPFLLHTRAGIAAFLKTYHDLVTAWVIFCRNEYSIPPEAKLVVDLGANIGLFTFQAASIARSAHIVAVEPFPPCYDRLVEGVRFNGLTSRVMCWRLAVAGAAGERFMPSVGPTQTNGLIPSSAPIMAGAVQVDAITLPMLLAKVRAHFPGQPIDLLKIDVEGAEREFLVQIPPGMLADVQAIGMEYHPNGNKTTLFAALAAQGLICREDRPFGTNVGVARFARN